MVTKGPRTDTTVVSKARQTVPAHSFMTVPIEAATFLPEDRDLLFEPSQLDTLTLSAYIVDYNMSGIVIRNDTDLPVTLIRYTRLGKVLKYEAEGYFSVTPEHAAIADKPLKRKALWIKRGFQIALIIAAAFSTITTSGNKLEIVHQIGATIYGDSILV